MDNNQMMANYDNRSVIFDIRLLCDIESYHYAILKNYISKISSKIIHGGMSSYLRNKSIEEGTKIFLKECGIRDSLMLKAALRNITEQFYNYTKIIKPLLFTYSLAQQLMAKNIKIFSYSCYGEEINKIILNHIPSGIPIISASKLNDYINSVKDQKFTLITSEDITKIISNDLLASKF